MNIKSFMAKDHKDCDALYAEAESAVANEAWETAEQAFDAFVHAMDRHLGVEEKELFPAFETETGMTTGPTEMMRMEHDQMRSLFTEMQNALASKNSDEYLNVAETLLILMQQHNMKEEQILYAIMDQRLSDDSCNWRQAFENWGK